MRSACKRRWHVSEGAWGEGLGVGIRVEAFHCHLGMVGSCEQQELQTEWTIVAQSSRNNSLIGSS